MKNQIHYEESKSPQCRAVCPVNPKHEAYVYCTRGKRRYCRCRECVVEEEGQRVTYRTWIQSAPEA